MEIFELKYFLGVARYENIHKASKELHVSPGSLSKAISRLENEIGVKLFYKQGRNIRLNSEGKLLQKRASFIVQLEEDARLEIGGGQNSLNIDIVGEEVLQSSFGVGVSKKIHKLYPQAKVHFMLANEKKSLQLIQDGDAHLAIVSSEVPKQLYSKTIDKVQFKVAVGKGHPLYKSATKNESIHISEILEYGFVTPSFSMLGILSSNISTDGWRDDKFPRKILFQSCGLKVLEKIVNSGLALAYLPSYFTEDIGLKTLNISGCPYNCSQKIKLVARDPERLAWLSNLVSTI